MQKHRNRRVRNKKVPEIPLLDLVRHVLVDLEVPLGLELSLQLSLVLEFKPEEFRAVVDQETRKAESALAAGGFDRYVALRQIDALLAKNVDWYGIPSAERKEAALRGFFDSEDACRRANKRIRWYGSRMSRLSDPLQHVLNGARLLIQEILGPLDEATRGEILDNCGHGPGATFGHSVQTGSLAEKLDSSYKHTATREALPFFVEYGLRNPQWVNHLLWTNGSYEIVEGNRVSTVPKKWDKDRTIGIEPSINVFLQKGLGDVIAKRLRRYGVMLDDQRRNQEAARLGSLIWYWLVTLDLRAASDSLPRAGVSFLLPGDWVALMDSLRSPMFRVSKSSEWREYEKYSSMGNGFTFPLESLIFYAIARSACAYAGASTRYLCVFGDDLVVPTEAALLTIEALGFLGFKVNGDKSHYLGPFRESCGSDYVNGVDVRPVYISERIKGRAKINDVYNRLLISSIYPLTETLAYISKRCPGSPVPGDFGIQLLTKEGWRPGVSVKLIAGFIADPPDPSGYCSSVQSDYWVFKEFCQRQKPLEPDKYHWRSNYLAFLKGTPEGVGRDSKHTFSYTREWYSFTWLSVAELRDQSLTRRLLRRGSL